MRNGRKGFVLVETLLIIVIIGVVTLAGWYVYQSVRKSDTTNSISRGNQSDSESIPKTIVAVGDITCDSTSQYWQTGNPKYCQDVNTYNLVKDMDVTAFLALGDLQYEDGSLSKFNTSYAKTWGKLYAITYPTPGNHEYNTAGAQGYFSYFDNAANKVSTSDDKGYYSFNIGNWHLISLDSNCDKIGGCGEGSEQMTWLEKDLNKNNKKCILAYWHHPRFTSGKYYGNEDVSNRSTVMWQKLYKYRADVVLNGHDHLYERFLPQDPQGASADDGIQQLTVGTGGKDNYSRKTVLANSQKLIDDEFGVLVMKLYDDSYNWSFLSIDGQAQDSGHRQCN